MLAGGLVVVILAGGCGALAFFFLFVGGAASSSTSREPEPDAFQGTVSAFCQAARDPAFVRRCEGKTVAVSGTAAADGQLLTLEDGDTILSVKLLGTDDRAEVLCSFGGAAKREIGPIKKGRIVTARGTFTAKQGPYIVSCR
jgi:hypothetical protein